SHQCSTLSSRFCNSLSLRIGLTTGRPRILIIMQSFAGSEGINGPVQTTEPVNLSRRIKERALLEGFDLVGIVAAEPLNDESARLKEWLARGYHGEMSWMARDPETRTNPCKLFPQARSVI